MKKRWWLFVIIAVVLFVLFVLLKKNIGFMKEDMPKRIFLTSKFELENLPLDLLGLPKLFWDLSCVALAKREFPPLKLFLLFIFV